MALPKRIFLTGFMGSGKSTVGPIVANVLGYDFVDLDAAIEAQAGKPVQRIFAEEGEAAFRALEAEALRATARRDRLLVAVGGGALTFEENLAWALAHGTVVYLRVSLDPLIRRLRRGRAVRPLLRDEAGKRLSHQALREKVRALLEHRERFYLRAHVVVEIGNRRVGHTVDAVVRALHRQGAGRPRRGGATAHADPRAPTDDG